MSTFIQISQNPLNFIFPRPTSFNILLTHPSHSLCVTFQNISVLLTETDIETYVFKENINYAVSTTDDPFYVSTYDALYKDLLPYSLEVNDNIFTPSVDIIVEKYVMGLEEALFLDCNGERFCIDKMKGRFVLNRGSKYRFGAKRMKIYGYIRRDEEDEIINDEENKKLKKEEPKKEKTKKIKKKEGKTNNIIKQENINKDKLKKHTVNPENSTPMFNQDKKIPKKGILKDHVEVKRQKKVSFMEENIFKFKTETKQKGNGRKIQHGDTVKIKYTGMLENGRIFDSTKKIPFKFVMGKGQVIKGLDMGMENMRVGEKRKIMIPSKLGYGSVGDEKIPSNSNLIFDVELVG